MRHGNGTRISPNYSCNERKIIHAKFRESPLTCFVGSPKNAPGRNISASHSLNLAGMFLQYSVDTATPKKYQNWPTFQLNLLTRDLITKGRGRPKEYERGTLQSRSAKSRFGKIAL